MTTGFVTAAFHAEPGLVFRPAQLGPAAPWPEINVSLAKPTIIDIDVWRIPLNEKYAPQLGETLAWNEASTYHNAVDVPVAAQTALYCAAALLALRDPTGSHQLAGQRQPSPADLQNARNAIEALGYRCRFPQLLLRVDYWLPFERDMIIEEPDWAGENRRFGSVAALRQELEKVERFLRQARSADKGPSPFLDQAILCVRSMMALATIAWSSKLPLWRHA
jgi:hypothetical protein